MKIIHRKNKDFQNQMQFQKLHQNSRNAMRLYKLTRLLESLPDARREEIFGLLAFTVDTIKDGASKRWLGQLLEILKAEVQANA